MDDAESRIRLACDRGDHAGAATGAIEAYGGEIFAFLVDRIADRDEADEVFSQFSEELWLSLTRFDWRCSARTWAYKLARLNLAAHYRAAARREHRHADLSESTQLARAVATARTATREHMKTEVKDRFRQLREQLPAGDQTLLILRVDRRLSWADIAEVMHDGEPSADPAEHARQSARLRQRFRGAKDRLRQLAQQEGLLTPD